MKKPHKEHAASLLDYITVSGYNWLQMNSTEEFIQKNQCEFDDRNLKVIFFENYKNSSYQSPSYITGNFGFWLVGYDGGVKLFSKDASILKNIFSTIDSMPMRKDEMSSKNIQCN